MTGSIGQIGGQPPYPPPGKMNSEPMSEEQIGQLQDIISQYDPENLSSDDRESMMTEIKEAGITPGKEFGQIMNEAGFKPPEKPNGPPPGQGPGMGPEAQMISDLLEQQQSGDLSQDELEDMLSNMQNSGLAQQGGLVNRLV